MKRECKHSRWCHILAITKVVGWNCRSCNHSEMYKEPRDYDYDCNCAGCHTEIVYDDNKVPEDKKEKLEKNAGWLTTCVCCGSTKTVHTKRD